MKPLDSYLQDWFRRRYDAALESDPNPEDAYGLEYVAHRAEVAFNDLLRKIQHIEIQHHESRTDDHQNE